MDHFPRTDRQRARIEAQWRLRLAVKVMAMVLVLLALAGLVVQETDLFHKQTVTKHSQVVPSPKPVVKQVLTIAANGDIMLGRRVADLIKQKGSFYPFIKVAPLISEADLVFGNLECPLSLRGTQLAGKGIWFRGDPAEAKDLRQAGYDIISVANNHTLDYNTPAFLDTLDSLKGAGIATVGGGQDDVAAAQPVIKDIQGYKVACLAATEMANIFWNWQDRRTLEAKPNQPGVNKLDSERMVSAVKSLQGKSDLIIISLHWGTEYADEPTPEQQELAHRLIDAGAKLIIGHHPHCLQGLESYHGGVIAYSLGNFIYDRQTRAKSQEGLLLRLTYQEHSFKEVTVTPTIIVQEQPQLAAGNDASRILQRATMLSKKLGSYLVIDGQKASLTLQ